MAATIEQALDALTDATLPLARLDPAVNAGTLLLVDFTDLRCNPLAGVTVATPLPTGTVLANLADSGLSGGVASTQGGATGLTVNIGGGISTPGATANGQSVSFGGAGAYDLQASNPNFMASVWTKMSSAALTAQTYKVLLALGAANNNLFYIDSGADNRSPRGTATSSAAAAGVPGALPFNGFALDAVQHLAITREGSVGRLWLNGAAVTTFTARVDLASMAGAILTMFDARSLLTIYRASIENLTVSVADAVAQGTTWSAAQAVAAEYTIGSARGFV